MKNCINRSNEPWGLSFAFRVSCKLENLRAPCLSWLCAAHHVGTRLKASALLILQGTRGLEKPKSSLSRGNVQGCLVKIISFFIFKIICIIFCLNGWQSALEMKAKGRVYEEKSNTGELSARKEIRLSMEAVSATSSPSSFLSFFFVL